MGSKVERLVDETSLKENDQEMLRKRRWVWLLRIVGVVIGVGRTLY